MQVTVKLFAGLRDIVGGDIVESFEGDSVPVSALRERLGEAHPKLAPYLAGVAIAVNEEYILQDGEELRDGDEVALIPPISGGSDESDDGDASHFLVTTEALDARALRDLVLTDASGAVVVFEGVVRDHHEGHAVLRLEYHAYDSMARRQLAAVAEEVLHEYRDRELHDIAIHHRTGTLEVGEVSLLVAVSAAHREDAFAAALRTVDRVKETVPVWKKEYGPDGATWQEGVEPKPAFRATAASEG